METAGSTTLIRRLEESGDSSSWREFFRRYAPLVWRFARAQGLPEDAADDVVQETMTSMIGAIRRKRFDRGKGQFKAFLRGLAYHKIQDRRSQRAREPQHWAAGANSSDPLAAIPARDDPCDVFEREWQQNLLQTCLDLVRAEVEPTTYQAFDLYAIKGWSADKAAGFLGVTRNAVYIAKARVLARIRALYADIEQS